MLSHPATARRAVTGETSALQTSLHRFPVVIGWDGNRQFSLQPRSHDARGAVAAVIAAIYNAARSGQLDRLKVCPAPECHWVFFDRTKPNTGRWCDPALCGNREKKRAYRRRKNH